jgi:hemerythrin-like domain-containing protein
MEATVSLIDLLQADHPNVLNRLDEVERVIGSFAEPKTVVADVEALGSFFGQDIWALVWKEEDALFPEIVRSDPREGSPIERMYVDHQRLRGMSERLQRSVDGYVREPGNENAMTLLRKSGQQIVALLRDHIKEESGMLEAAVARFDEAQTQRVLEMFDAIDADLTWCFEQLDEFQP